MCASAPPSSAHAIPTTIDLTHHHKRRPAPQLRKQHQQIVQRQRDAARRRCIAWACKMHEDGAAPPLHARAVVIPEHEHEVVEMVSTGQTIGALQRGKPDHLVIVAILRIFAPAVAGADRMDRKLRPRPRHAIGAIEQLANGKAAERCRAVALPLKRLDAAPAERRAPHAMRQGKAPFPRISGRTPQLDVTLNSHDRLAFFLLGEANRPACPMGRPPLLLETSEFTRGQPWAMRARS